MTQLSDNSALTNDVHVMFLDAPNDADAYSKNLFDQIFWVKDITDTSYKYVYADEINKSLPVKWMKCGRLTGQTLCDLVYRPVDMVESPEEKEAFDRISREQQINAMAAVIRTCPTNSSTGIATLLHEAGCSMKTPIVRK
jgi:hypothetical protein